MSRTTPHFTSLRAAAAVVTVVTVAMTAGCTGPSSGSVVLDPDTDKPFVLRGVSNLTEIAQLTGPGAINDTEAVGVAGTDLGSMVGIGDKTLFLFGDTFGERDPNSQGGQGGNWRSNVSAWSTDDDPSDGITFGGWTDDGIGGAAALVEGDHAANDGHGEVTKIPTSGFAIEDTVYLQYMSVNFWGAAGQWDTNYAGLAKSTDEGQTWTALDAPRWPGESNFIQLAPANVTEGGEGYLYFWAIPSGRFGSVKLMKVAARVEAVEDPAAYMYFSGVNEAGDPTWSRDLNTAETVLEGTIGELSVMWSTYLQRWIMTYSDAGNAYIREGITPWGPWGDAFELASSADYPGLYAPYMHPRYVADGGRTVYFDMSLWGPYNVFWFSINLDKAP